VSLLKAGGRNLRRGIWLWPVVSVLMLIGMLAEARTHVQPTEAAPHLQRCANAVAAFPYVIDTNNGSWTGKDTEMPTPAIQLLRPNAILSREYRNGQRKQVVEFLIVDCSDARDLQGHYPPNCYPALGESELMDQRKTRIWHLPHMDVTGMEYHFAPKSLTDSEQVVYNFFVMPIVPALTVSHKELDGKICPDISSVYTSGEDYQRRYYGAAEFQLVTGPQMKPQDRDEALIDLLSSDESLLRTLENRPDAGVK
jgi:hypothetical protein